MLIQALGLALPPSDMELNKAAPSDRPMPNAGAQVDELLRRLSMLLDDCRLRQDELQKIA
jgi:hypothetical protein